MEKFSFLFNDSIKYVTEFCGYSVNDSEADLFDFCEQLVTAYDNECVDDVIYNDVDFFDKYKREICIHFDVYKFSPHDFECLSNYDIFALTDTAKGVYANTFITNAIYNVISDLVSVLESNK